MVLGVAVGTRVLSQKDIVLGRRSGRTGHQTSPGCWTDRSWNMSRTLKIVPDCGGSHTAGDRKVVMKVGRGRRQLKSLEAVAKLKVITPI